VAAKTPEPGDTQPGGEGRAASELSALEQALRQALESVPRDQVVKCIVSVLPADVLVEETGRLHASRVRKVSVSMPEELAEAIRSRTGPGGFSRYVTDAVNEKVRLDLLDELSAELEAEYGPIPHEIRRHTRQTWPNYPGE
jgi:Arc/MetJ-type ribon-helix-helix transcriptional regulator